MKLPPAIRPHVDRLAQRFGYVRRRPLRPPSAKGRDEGRAYPAGENNRLTADWGTTTLSADASIFRNLVITRARCRDLAERNDYALKFLSMLRTNVLGEAGMLLKSMAKDPDKVMGGTLMPGQPDIFARSRIEDAWHRWGQKENCTVTRDMTWQEVNEVALTANATDGECLIRIVRGFDNEFNVALQLLESDHLDETMNKELPNGHRIRMGIEQDAWGAPVAYWLRTRHPNDTFFGAGSVTFRHERVPAMEIVHPYVLRRIGASRGLPWMATPAYRLKMIDGYEENELVGSRVASGKMGFFERDINAPGGYTGDDDGIGNKIMDAEPGSFEELPPGVTLKSWDPQHPNSNYDAFMKRTLRGVAAGLLCSYNALADDMESVNFSSARIGLIEPREIYKLLQCWWASDVCQPVFDGWLQVQLVIGQLGLPLAKQEKFRAVAWKGRRWAYIEPSKDIDAAIRRINSGISTLTKELSELGIDRDEHLDELSDDLKALETRKLTERLPELFKAAQAKAEQPEQPEADVTKE